MSELTMRHPATADPDDRHWRVFTFGRHELVDHGSLTAAEQMFFFQAPLAHVIDWQEHRSIMLRRKAGRMMFVTSRKRRGLVVFE
jgi:hypothetical protein